MFGIGTTDLLILAIPVLVVVLREPFWRIVSNMGIKWRPDPILRLATLVPVLVGFLMWFAYDGWFNPRMEWQLFNRIGAAVLGAIAIVLVARILRARRDITEGRSTWFALLFESPDRSTIVVATAPPIWTLTVSGLNFVPHQMSGVAVLTFIGSLLSFGLLALPVALVSATLVRRHYIRLGWHEIRSRRDH